jgi:hypothetical protein
MVALFIATAFLRPSSTLWKAFFVVRLAACPAWRAWIWSLLIYLDFLHYSFFMPQIGGDGAIMVGIGHGIPY